MKTNLFIYLFDKFVVHTLQAFSRGCKNDDLKRLTAFPNEVPFHSENQARKNITCTGQGKYYFDRSPAFTKTKSILYTWPHDIFT